MDDSGAILFQISSFKDMLDQVNEEIERNIEITRDIESEVVKCEEIESALSSRESELTQSAYALQFEINGLLSVRADSERSVNFLKDELCRWRMIRDEIKESININRLDYALGLQMILKREPVSKRFISTCLDFQKGISNSENDESESLLFEKERVKDEIQSLNKQNRALQNSMSAFVEEVLEDLGGSISALEVEIHSKKLENEKLLKEIDELKATILSVTSSWGC